MSVVDLVKKPARTCTLAWCNGDHHETRSYRSHGSEVVHDGPSRFGRISWDEPLDAAARFVDRGTQIFVWMHGAEMRLTVRDANSLWKMLRAVGATEQAEFVGRMIVATANGAES